MDKLNAIDQYLSQRKEQNDSPFHIDSNFLSFLDCTETVFLSYIIDCHVSVLSTSDTYISKIIVSQEDVLSCTGISYHLQRIMRKNFLKKNIFSSLKQKNGQGHLFCINYTTVLLLIKKPSPVEKVIPIVPEPPKPTVLRVNKFIDYWNKDTQGSKHRAGTQRYKHISAIFRSLQKGTFYTTRRIEDDTLDLLKITGAEQRHLWSDEEIYKGLDRLKSLFIEGEWPEDKSKLPRDLGSLMYNVRSRKSFFLSQYFSERVPRKDFRKLELTSSQQVFYDRIQKKFKMDLSDNKSQRRLQECVINIHNYHSWLSKQTYISGRKVLGFHLQTFRNFSSEYLKQYESMISFTPAPHTLDITCTFWSSFLEHLQTTYWSSRKFNANPPNSIYKKY